MTIENEKILKEAICNVCRMEKESGYVDEKLNNDNCDLKEELGFDSLLFVELVVEIEEAFGFEFDVNAIDMKNLRYLGELKEIVDKYISER